jgi:hypothetical protein
MDAQELQKAQKMIDKIQRDLDYVKKMLLDAQKPSFEDVPGVEGTFDGVYMTTESGEKFEVPANYAAKSRLLYGDNLKMVEDDGKKLFKQVSKRPRKKVEGVLSKKEGEWYILADSGSYKISNVAAEFNKAEINDKAIALVPEDNPKVPFAALDRMLKAEKEEKPVEEVKPEKKVVKAEKEEKPVEVAKKTAPAAKKAAKPKIEKPKVTPAEPKEEDKGVVTIQGLEEDDLR